MQKDYIKTRTLLIFIILLSFIPLTNYLSIFISGALLSASIIFYNIECIKNSYSKIKIVFQTLGIFCLYYILSLFITSLTYISTISKLAEYQIIPTTTLDVGFIFLNIKMVLLFIPFAISSILCFKKGVVNYAFYRIFILINTLIFVFITK